MGAAESHNDPHTMACGIDWGCTGTNRHATKDPMRHAKGGDAPPPISEYVYEFDSRKLSWGKRPSVKAKIDALDSRFADRAPTNATPVMMKKTIERTSSEKIVVGAVNTISVGQMKRERTRVAATAATETETRSATTTAVAMVAGETEAAKEAVAKAEATAMAATAVVRVAEGSVGWEAGVGTISTTSPTSGASASATWRTSATPKAMGHEKPPSPASIVSTPDEHDKASSSSSSSSVSAMVQRFSSSAAPRLLEDQAGWPEPPRAAVSTYRI